MALTLQHTTCQKHAPTSKSLVAHMKEEEEEEELFEIDLEAVNNLPSPYYWESYVTATTYTLFANCLVPIADVSSAVPMANPSYANETWLGPQQGSRSGKFIWENGVEPLQNFVGISSLGALSNLLQKTLIASSSFNQGK